MKIFIIKAILLLSILPVFVFANENFSPFVKEQISIIKKMNNDEISKKEMLTLVKKQELLFEKSINKMLADKKNYIDNLQSYQQEIYSLEKLIKINKRYSNTYAVLRDEVMVKVYKVLDAQNEAIIDLLKAMDHKTFNEFKDYTVEVYKKNKNKIAKIDNFDYKPYISKAKKSQNIPKKLKENIELFYNVVELSNDYIEYFTRFELSKYKMNEYAKYGLLEPVMKINNLQTTKDINAVLSKVGLSIVKLIMIVFVSLFIFIIKKYLYQLVENLFVRLSYTKKHAHEIFKSLKKVFGYLLIFINIEIAVFIYNDFVSNKSIAAFFTILYSIIFTIMLYKVANKVASIKVNKLIINPTNIKASVVNVAIKIINFIIIIIGVLLVLYFAGINLTAVLSGLGIGGFAVALAAKDSLANFFGTLSILLGDTFRQGDWIVATGVEGTVVEIGLRVTIVRTFDNALISIPNANLANADIKNWNRRELGRRIKMSLGVKYDSKSEDIKNAVKEIREMLLNHPNIATDKTQTKRASGLETKVISYEDLQGIKKTLLVYLDEFSDSSINILVYCFSKTVNWAEWLEVKEDVMHKIMDIFEKNNLEFAFPSMSIYKEN